MSSNIAPASSTTSVTKNVLLKAGFGGSQYFPPIEIFQPATANVLMALLLLADVCNPASCAHPAFPLANPLDLFAVSAVHGGMWPHPYRLRAVSEVAAIMYFLVEGGRTLVLPGLGAAGFVAYRRLSRL